MLKSIKSLYRSILNIDFITISIVTITGGLLYLVIQYKDFVYFFCFLIAFFILLLKISPRLLSSKKIVIKFDTKNKSKQVPIKINNFSINQSVFTKHSLLVFLFYICSITYLIFNFFVSTKGSKYFIINYTRSLITTNNSKYVIVVFLIPFLFWFLYQLLKTKSLSKSIKQTSTVITTYFGLFIVSLYSAILFTIMIFSFQINYLFSVATTSPSKLGMVINKEDIVKNLKQLDKAPKVNVIKPIPDIKFYTHLLKNGESKKKLIYEIINFVPKNYLVANKKLPSLFILNSELYLTELNKDEIEYISPFLTKLIVKNYINKRYIKDEPNISIISRQEYLKYREDQINNNLTEIDEQIEITNSILQEAYNNTAQTKQLINEAQHAIENSISKRDYYYNYCLNAGYQSYFTGKFYYYFTKAECDAKLSEWNNSITIIENDLNTLQNNLIYYQKVINEFEIYKEDWLWVRELVESQKSHTSYELGVFIPEKTIKIALDSINPKDIKLYLSTLAHEYFHYTSYVSNERQLPLFFEEGLTEYFARKSIKKSLGIDINIGYPIITKVIEEMSKKVGDKEFENIYFTKDVDQLMYILNQAYGDNFYEDSEYYFTALYYIQSVESLKFANNIMFKIGGKKITQDSIN